MDSVCGRKLKNLISEQRVLDAQEKSRRICSLGFRNSTKVLGTKDRNLGVYSIKLRDDMFVCEVFQGKGGRKRVEERMPG